MLLSLLAFDEEPIGMNELMQLSEYLITKQIEKKPKGRSSGSTVAAADLGLVIPSGINCSSLRPKLPIAQRMELYFVKGAE